MKMSVYQIRRIIREEVSSVDPVAPEFKKVAQDFQDMMDFTKKSFDLFNKSQSLQNTLGDVLRKRFKVISSIMNAIEDGDKNAVKKGREALKVVDAELIAAGKENSDALMQWASHVESKGMSFDPALKKGLDAQIKSNQEEILATYERLDKMSDIAEKKVEAAIEAGKVGEEDGGEKYKRWAMKSLADTGLHKKGEYGAVISFAAAYISLIGDIPAGDEMLKAKDAVMVDFKKSAKAVMVTEDEARKILSKHGLEYWMTPEESGSSGGKKSNLDSNKHDSNENKTLEKYRKEQIAVISSNEESIKELESKITAYQEKMRSAPKTKSHEESKLFEEIVDPYLEQSDKIQEECEKIENESIEAEDPKIAMAAFQKLKDYLRDTWRPHIKQAKETYKKFFAACDEKNLDISQNSYRGIVSIYQKEIETLKHSNETIKKSIEEIDAKYGSKTKPKVESRHTTSGVLLERWQKLAGLVG